MAFLNSLLLIIHVVSVLKNSRRFYYFQILFGPIRTSFRDVSYFRSKYLCRSEKVQTNETGTEDHGSTITRIVRICTEESGNPFV